MSDKRDFTKGNIGKQLTLFIGPIMLTIFLQSFYGAVDLLIVGRFGNAADVSAVATGTNMMATITFFITALAVGSTVIIGQEIGAGNKEKAGRTMGTSVAFFFLVAVVVTLLMIFAVEPFARALNAPEEAFAGTISYALICSYGAVFIVFYNLIGSIFRGFGDSKTPLITVAFAAFFNIFGDLLLVGKYGLGPSGAAIATVAAQAFSVLISMFFVAKKGLPFDFKREYIRLEGAIIGRLVKIGVPLALQDFLVSLSFLIIAAIVNSLGLIASAGVGVAEKIIHIFIIVPVACEQALAAYVAQNTGAGKPERAKEALRFVVKTSTLICIILGVIVACKGSTLSAIFSNDETVIAASADYLIAFGIDMLIVPLLFCFIGYFNGRGLTRFVMIQGIFGALAVRVPMAYAMARIMPTSLFRVGLATPISDIATIILCIWYYRRVTKDIE